MAHLPRRASFPLFRREHSHASRKILEPKRLTAWLLNMNLDLSAYPPLVQDEFKTVQSHTPAHAVRNRVRNRIVRILHPCRRGAFPHLSASMINVIATRESGRKAAKGDGTGYKQTHPVSKVPGLGCYKMELCPQFIGRSKVQR